VYYFFLYRAPSVSQLPPHHARIPASSILPSLTTNGHCTTHSLGHIDGLYRLHYPFLFPSYVTAISYMYSMYVSLPTSMYFLLGAPYHGCESSGRNLRSSIRITPSPFQNPSVP
jgi:hypothetical protein